MILLGLDQITMRSRACDRWAVASSDLRTRRSKNRGSAASRSSERFVGLSRWPQMVTREQLSKVD